MLNEHFVPKLSIAGSFQLYWGRDKIIIRSFWKQWTRFKHLVGEKFHTTGTGIEVPYHQFSSTGWFNDMPK